MICSWRKLKQNPNKMINGFEDQTHELTEYELRILLPGMINGLRTKVGSKNSITSGKAIKGMKEKRLKIDSPRFRKLINYIRIKGMIHNLVASSKGYHIATSQSECERFIESLDQRINAITTVRDAMFYQMNQTIKDNEGK